MVDRWPFVGRAAELARIEAAHAAGTGTIVVGAEGVGKTALARVVTARVEAAAGKVVCVLGRGASTPAPLEAFGPLLDAVTATSEGVTVGDRLRRRLGAAPTQRLTLVVDDAHLLDDASAEVLLKLAAGATAVVLATVRSDATVPHAISRLWQDGHCERLELPPLADDAVLALLEAALDGQVDEGSAQRLSELAQGNSLLLKEVVAAAIEHGALARRGEVWRLVGDPPLSGGIRQLVAERVGALDPMQRSAVEMIAAGEPLPLAIATDMVGESMLEQLESRGVFEVLDSLPGWAVRLAHPLYGEVVREGLPRLRLRRLRLTLARALEGGADPLPHDRVRAATWQLDAGADQDLDRLLAAARTAQAFSLDLAERLARRAFEVSGSMPAALLLAEILTHNHDSEGAATLLAGLPPAALTPADREAVAYCTAMGQGLLGGDPARGASIIEDVLAGVPEASPRLRAVHGMLVAIAGRSQDAIEIADPLLGDEELDPASRTFAALAVTGARYGLGQYQRAVAEGERMLPVAQRALEAVPFGPAALYLSMISAMAECGELDRAEAMTLDLLAGSGADHSNWVRPRADYCRGRAALVRGRVVTALRLFRSTVAGLNSFDQTFALHNRSMVARAAAAAGRLDEAAQALQAPPEAPRLRVYETEWELAEAALIAARGELAEAVDRASWVAELAASRSQWMLAVLAGHDTARYGGAHLALPGIRAAVSHVDGTLAWCYLDHAAALATGDAAALDEVSRRFQTCGALLYAAESATAAAAAHTAAGSPRAARASSALADSLRAQCEGAVSPWLVGAPSSVPLTPREREVAALAASGRSDAEIARLLSISARTVQTHLARTYDKLGVHGRQALRRQRS